MFKASMLRFFRKLWKAESPHAAPEPVQDLQTRLQHLSERYPSAEPCVDADHVQMHEIELCEVDFATEQELALGCEGKGLNNWASKRRKTGSSDALPALKKHPFDYQIDPGRAPSRSADDHPALRGPDTWNNEPLREFEKHREKSDSQWVPLLRRENDLQKMPDLPRVSRKLESAHDSQSRSLDTKLNHDSQPRSRELESRLEQRAQRLRDVESRRNQTPPPQISDIALREMTRLELVNRAQISRSLSGFHEDEERDTVLADKWDCAEYNSLFSLPDASRYGTTTEYEEDYEEDLLPYFTETLLLQEEELADPADTNPADSNSAYPNSADPQFARLQPATTAPKKAESVKNIEVKPTGATESSTALQPYKSFSENALKLIAQKPETPAPTLKWLASHSNPHIRAAVAKNPSTPSDTITVLAKDHEAGIRHSIAENPLSSVDALNLLVKDRNPLIAWRAQNTVFQNKEAQRAAQKAKEQALLESQKEQKEAVHHVKEAKIATTEETIAFMQVIARKTNTPARRLDDLAKHADPRVRAAVAENANAPAEILWILAKDPDSTVKTKVTDNYNCPIEILEAMKEDEDAYVAYQAHSVLNRILGATFSDNHLRTATWP